MICETLPAQVERGAHHQTGWSAQGHLPRGKARHVEASVFRGQALVEVRPRAKSVAGCSSALSEVEMLASSLLDPSP